MSRSPRFREPSPLLSPTWQIESLSSCCLICSSSSPMKSSNGEKYFAFALLIRSFNSLEMPPAGIAVNQRIVSPGMAGGCSPASPCFCWELGNAPGLCKRPSVGGGQRALTSACFAFSTSHLFWKILAQAWRWRGNLFRVSHVEFTPSYTNVSSQHSSLFVIKCSGVRPSGWQPLLGHFAQDLEHISSSSLSLHCSHP